MEDERSQKSDIRSQNAEVIEKGSRGPGIKGPRGQRPRVPSFQLAVCSGGTDGGRRWRSGGLGALEENQPASLVELDREPVEESVLPEDSSHVER